MLGASIPSSTLVILLVWRKAKPLRKLIIVKISRFPHLRKDFLITEMKSPVEESYISKTTDVVYYLYVFLILWRSAIDQ